jgi:hypothetical protein
MDLRATADLPHTLQGDGPRRAALGRTGLYGWRATQGRHEEGPVCSTAGFYPLYGVFTHYGPTIDPLWTPIGPWQSAHAIGAPEIPKIALGASVISS